MDFFKQCFDNNISLRTDSYKLTHWRQYRKGTTKVVSYLEARKGALYPTVLVVGIQPYIKELENLVITKEQIEVASWFSSQHFGNELFNKEGWLRLLEKHNGKLPILIKAVKEGSEVEVGNVLMTIENTDDEFPWLTNYIESFLMKVWYPITIATNSFYCKKVLREAIHKTSQNLDYLNFALHDFGYRGVSSEETAGIGGMAHLVNFMGTDNLSAIIYANKYYNPEIKDISIDNYTEKFKMYGYSIAASEHSTATPFGRDKGEIEYIKHMLDIYQDQAFSIVMDSYDAFGFPEKLKQFKGIIEQRKAKMVLRPDSGNPVEVILNILNQLSNIFGHKYKNHFKVLPTNIGIIQGDGIDYDSLKEITKAVVANGWSIDNIVFGSGGGLLQKFNRDTQRFAIKCCSTTYNGEEIDVKKDPSTDNTKSSKSGYLKLIKLFKGTKDKPRFMTLSSSDSTPEQFKGYVDELKVVFENGDMKRFQKFEEVRMISKLN